MFDFDSTRKIDASLCQCDVQVFPLLVVFVALNPL